MRNKVAKLFNKWARVAELSKSEKRKLKKDWTNDPNSSIMELTNRIERISETLSGIEEVEDETTN